MEYGKIDPEFEQLIAQQPMPFKTSEFPTTESAQATIKEMVTMMATAGVIPMPDMTGLNKEEIHIPMRDNGPNHSLVYRPDNSTEPGPLIVLFHGGGWCTGFPELTEIGCVQMAKTFGATVIAAGYRLASANTFPTAPNDAWDVVKWAAANAKSLGAEPSKGFIVSGVSAGGNLACVVSHLARDEKLSPPLTGIWLDAPSMVDPSVLPEKWKKDYQSREQNKNAPILDEADLQWYQRFYKPDIASPLFSPLIWPSGHKDLPPHYILLQGLDPLRDEGLIYERHLREDCGVKTKLDVIPGLPHAFHHFMPTFSKTGPTHKLIFEGIGWLLQQK